MKTHLDELWEGLCEVCEYNVEHGNLPQNEADAILGAASSMFNYARGLEYAIKEAPCRNK